MQMVLLIAFIAFVSSCAATSTNLDFDRIGVAKTNPDADRVLAAEQKIVHRSLRWHEPGKVAGFKDEERGAIDKVEDVASKVSGLVVKAAKTPSKLNALIVKNMKEFDEFATRPSLVSKLSERYNVADKLSFSTLKQLDKIENMRALDVAKGIKGSKTTPNSMRRKITPFEGMKMAPEKFMSSHVGRNTQRYGKDKSRWLSASVVTRTTDQGERQILLISSSNPTKSDFLLPKGGWDTGEKVKKAALREVIEEGGVNAQLAYDLGKIKFSEASPKGEDPKKYKYFGYLMRSNTIYDDWSESVSYDDALKLLAGRTQMVQLVKRAKSIEDRIASGKLPEVSPNLAKVKLDLA